jgi:predicted TIM-barrel fold metal-dependent hydrolase
VADEMERYVEEGGIDGFLVEPTFGGVPSYQEFVDLVIPELRARGRIAPLVEGQTLRERLFGAGPRVNERHRAAAHRVGA